MHATGKYSISDLADVVAVSRPTVYRTLKSIMHFAPYGPFLKSVEMSVSAKRTILPPTGAAPNRGQSEQ